jgi:molecular chaperone IbpA
MAVAGFSPGKLDVTVEANTLRVSGKSQKDKETKNGNGYLHRGIARRAFERRFSLADRMKVTSPSRQWAAPCRAGEAPEAAKPRTIEIGTGLPSLAHRKNGR